MPIFLIPLVVLSAAGLKAPVGRTVRAATAVPMYAAPSVNTPSCGELAAGSSTPSVLDADGFVGVAQGKRTCWVESSKVSVSQSRALLGMLPLADVAVGVVTAGAQLVFSNPTLQENVTRVVEGTAVTVLEQGAGVVKVKTPDGKIGWMVKKGLQDAVKAVSKTAEDVRAAPSAGPRIAGLAPGQWLTVLSNAKGFAQVKLEDGTVGFVTETAVATVKQLAPLVASEGALAAAGALPGGALVQAAAKAGSAAATAIPSPAGKDLQPAPATTEVAIDSVNPTDDALVVRSWLQRQDGTRVDPGESLSEGEAYEVHAVCSRDCYVRVTGETPEMGIICQYSPNHVKGFDVSRLLRAGEDAWTGMLPTGAVFRVFPPLMTRDVVRVEAVPAQGGQPFRYVPTVSAGQGCTPNARGTGTSRSVGIDFGPSEGLASAAPGIAPVVHELAFSTRPKDGDTLALFTADELQDAEAQGRSRGLFDFAGPKKKTDGPVIQVRSPTVGRAVKAPMDVMVAFVPREEGAQVDVNSFKARVWLGPVSKDITGAVKKYVTLEGIHAPGTEAPTGSFKIEVSIKDNRGRESVEVVDVTIK